MNENDDRASELDGPGAIISHAEVLTALREMPGCTPGEVARDLGVSITTVRRCRANLRNAGLLE